MEYRKKLQHEISFRVYHDNAGWHIVECAHFSRKGWTQPARLVRWRGIGIPATALALVAAMASDEVEQHLVQRYGVQGELPFDDVGDR